MWFYSLFQFGRMCFGHFDFLFILLRNFQCEKFNRNIFGNTFVYTNWTLHFFLFLFLFSTLRNHREKRKPMQGDSVARCIFTCKHFTQCWRIFLKERGPSLSLSLALPARFSLIDAIDCQQVAPKLAKVGQESTEILCEFILCWFSLGFGYGFSLFCFVVWVCLPSLFSPEMP